MFEASVSEVTEAELGSSWAQGCPVAVEDLRLITMNHWDFNGGTSTGELVVHSNAAGDLVGVFGQLFEKHYPIERMELVTAYGANDNDSMAANNTSAFNCRVVAGTDTLSQHAYGLAVDINPLINPYVVPSGVFPPAGSEFLDRTVASPGLIMKGDATVAAFEQIGWIWGGTWVNKKDYQHFSLTGE